MAPLWSRSIAAVRVRRNRRTGLRFGLEPRLDLGPDGVQVPDEHLTALADVLDDDSSRGLSDAHDERPGSGHAATLGGGAHAILTPGAPGGLTTANGRPIVAAMLTAARGGLIERRGLRARITAALRDGSVVLIAGAGYGKTTALQQALVRRAVAGRGCGAATRAPPAAAPSRNSRATQIGLRRVLGGDLI